MFVRHVKKYHSTPVTPLVDNSIKLNDSAGNVGISETNFDLDLSEDENDTNADRSSHITFDSSDEECITDFWEEQMCEQMNEWSANKLQKTVLPVFYNLTVISRALSRDPVLKKIMKKACYFQKKGLCESDSLDHAVSVYRWKYHPEIIPPAGTLISDEFFDVWAFINDVLNGEESCEDSFTHVTFEMTPANVKPGPQRLRSAVVLVSYYVRAAAIWRHTETYSDIKKIFKKKVKDMSFEKALKHAVEKKKFEILRKLGSPLVHVTVDDESETKRNNILEDDIIGAEALFF